jgi:hypothetical protein
MNTFPRVDVPRVAVPPGCEELTYDECKQLHMAEMNNDADERITYAKTKQSQRSIVTQRTSKSLDSYSRGELLEAGILEENIISFYVELLQGTIQGIVFNSDDDAIKFANETGFEIIQTNYPTFEHYVQFYEQISKGKQYWDTDVDVKRATAYTGKLNYHVGIRNNNYIALVVYYVI